MDEYTDGQDRERQHTSMSAEPIRGDYHPADNLPEYFPPRLNSPDRLQSQIKGGGEGTDDARKRWWYVGGGGGGG